MIRRVRIVFLFLSPLLLLVLALMAGLRFNHTHSFPVGVYWTAPKVPALGDLVMFDPPDTPLFRIALERGYILSGGFRPYEQMLKRLVATSGDLVTIDDAGVMVNGQRLKNSRPLASDLDGRPMPTCRMEGYQLAPGEVLLMSDYSPISFDGRYFGPIAREQVQSVVRPVWTW